MLSSRDTATAPYRELPPPPALASHVACVWVRTDPPRRILPDGCVDLVWTGAGLIVAGPSTRATLPRLPPGEPKLGIRFRVGAAGAALGLPAEALLDRSPSIDAIWADGDELADRVADAQDVAGRLRVLTEATAARLSEASPPDPLVRAALSHLSNPRRRVSALSKRLAISERQLRRRFNRAVGYSPRTLARVLRLQRFLTISRSGGGLASVAAEAGYADQPHLTRDCAALTGLPAGALLATGAGPAGERVNAA